MFRRRPPRSRVATTPRDVLTWWEAAHGMLTSRQRTDFLDHPAINKLSHLAPDRVFNAVAAHQHLDEALACASWHSTRDETTSPTNWRMLTPRHVARLKTQKKLIVRRGEFIRGRFKMPELVVQVADHGMTLSTLDQAGNAWQRRQQPGEYWVTFRDLSAL